MRAYRPYRIPLRHAPRVIIVPARKRSGNRVWYFLLGFAVAYLGLKLYYHEPWRHQAAQMMHSIGESLTNHPKIKPLPRTEAYAKKRFLKVKKKPCLKTHGSCS